MFLDFSIIESHVFWFSLATFLFLIELSAAGTIYSILLGFSAFVAGIVSLFVSDIHILLIVFAVLSFLSVFFAKPFLAKRFQIQKEIRPSTIDSLIGKDAFVIKEITSNSKGLVKVGFEEWTAASLYAETFEIDEVVVIEKIEGATLYIGKKSNGGEK